MEVYQSSKTAAEMEFALGAIPSIGENNHWFIGDQDTGVSAEGLTPYVGENGNWWVGETDTGFFAGGVKVEGAEVGQTIVITAVDENGMPTAWKSANLDAPDEYVTIFHKVFETAVANTDEFGGEYFLHGSRHFWCTDVDGNDLELDGVYIRIAVPAQTENIVTCNSVIPGVGKGKATWWGSYLGNDQMQPCVADGTFVNSNGTQVWSCTTFDLRARTLTAFRQTGQAFNGNFLSPAIVSAGSFEYTIAKNAWDCWNGVELYLVGGSLPAGTEMLIYGRKLNANKIPNVPKWGVVE